MENSNEINTVSSNLEENTTTSTNPVGEVIEQVTEMVNPTEEVVEDPNGPKVIQTDVGNKDGQNKCPKCGATDITHNIKTGKLRCNFCRFEFEPQKVEGLADDLNKLEGQVFTSGTADVDQEFNGVITLKCDSCGAEVVVDTNSAQQARCHWCRNFLSINKQIPNGSVPDVVLPFKVTKNDARVEIEKFVGKRKFFAHPTFKKEFTTENVMGVYFPYMIVDVNAHAKLSGQGEHLVRSYTVGDNEHRETRYDADLYNVEREFDVVIDDLTVESSKDKLSRDKEKTNNIINSIMPFDTENCVKFDANYIKGYNSEKRDTNVSDLKGLVDIQCKDIAKFSANDSLKTYDRGVRWDNETVEVKGEQWQSAYLPVWLYSYMEKKGDKKLLHYVAVNARTKETMGSVPIHMPKLFLVSFIVEILGVMLFMFADDFDWNWIFLAAGFVYYFIMFARYRNQGARHRYETETKTEISNLRKVDDFVKHEKGLSNSHMKGANNKSISSGSQTLNNTASSKAINAIKEASGLNNIIKK